MNVCFVLYQKTTIAIIRHMTRKPLWDIFCQVIDNWGDAGICWRLAQQLSQRNIRVRLWMDDTSPLSWMAPQASSTTPPDIEILHWQQNPAGLACGDVLLEAFGCRAPESVLQHLLSHNPTPPVWVNLEYLSAQKYAQQSHGLPSPQQNGPGKGLNCWFFYPGFSPQTGGLLRENHLQEQQARFDATAWLQQQQIPVLDNALRVSLFSYENQALAPLWMQWQCSQRPVHLLVTPGISTRTLAGLVGEAALVNAPPRPQAVTQPYGSVTVTWLPFYSQQDFDHLLWSCDINFVRGEDSWIRAIWAAKPFIWQPYVQDDGEHMNKLQAFLDLVSGAPDWKAFEYQWNQQTSPDWELFVATLQETQQRLKALRETLEQQPDLVTSLIRFVHAKKQIL